MVFCKTGVWTTGVVNDDSVTAALVLAESIRRTRSRFPTTCITSSSVAPENRAKLQNGFDMVFLMDETCMPGINLKQQQDDSAAKAYAFVLMLFDKCVFVSANSLFVENADNLFSKTDHKFQAEILSATGRYDLSCFAIAPNKMLCNQVCESVAWNGQCITNDYLGLWLKNQDVVLESGRLPDGILAKFSVSQGRLLSERAYAPIILFEELRNGSDLSVDQVKNLGKLDMGRSEMLIRKNWLEIQETLTTTTFPEMRLPILENHDNEPIAIVGMSCRYPGASSLEEFWKLLYAGNEGICEPPVFRWRKEQALRVTQQDRKSQAGFLTVPVDEFDTRFFGISPKEAVYMDPQVRLMHEVLWESLEDAGIDPISLYGSHTGVFTGSWMNDYKDIVTYSPEKEFFRTYMGNSIGAAAARLSFLLGLTGPSIATESGCSSAIVAVDLAVKSLRNGETNLALAGGVNLILHPFYSGMLEYVVSPDGRCKTFDEKADGFGRAEGCGVLVLKRMSDAMRDRDNIWALIRGSAVSQEGLSRSLGTPTVHCEALAMQLALKDAGVKPEQVSFVETHGTGTSVGDPMEVAAIAKAYYSSNRKEPLVIGSVKTNVGHTESCSGITGIMKSVLALQHELIPKHLNFEKLNPEIFLEKIPAILPLEHVAWPKVKGQPRLCGVSSFGITGTDGHVILQEAPDYVFPQFALDLERPTHILKLSGKSTEALGDLLKEYENRFEKMAENASSGSFADTAYSANVGRASFNHRAFLVAQDFQGAIKAIQENKYFKGEPRDGNDTNICFLFTGQGSQYSGMAKTLYETSPIFRIHFDACNRILEKMYNVSIKKVLWESVSDSKELSRTIFSQTSIFCVEYCLFKLWESWGIKPDYVLGHSLGEFCAAVAAEILSFEDALTLVAERSRLIDSLPRGSMLVVKASKPEVERLLKSAKIDLDFAAVNHPEQTVVAGDTKTIENFKEYVKSQDVKAIVLEATHAFHSRHMDPMLEKYRSVAKSINYKPGNRDSIQYISGMEGKLITDLSEINANYWVRHTREKVNFIQACAALKEVGCTDFLEVGPQPVLNTFVMMNNEGISMNCLPSLRKGTDDWETILTSLGKLYLLGYQVYWKGFDELYPRKKVPLPFHPFQRKSFWVECSGDYWSIIHPLVGSPMKNASALSIFQNSLNLKAVPYVKDHCVGSRIIFPGAGFTEMCLSAGFIVAHGLSEELEQPTRPIKVENVRIEAPLEFREGKSVRMQVLVDLPEVLATGSQDSASENGFQVKIYHQNANDIEMAGKWVLHATSTFVPVASTKTCMKLWNPSRIQEIVSQAQGTAPDNFYVQADTLGLKFGETFRSITEYWPVHHKTGNGEEIEVVTKVKLPAEWNKYFLHPLIIDAMFQTSLISSSKTEDAKLKIPVGIGELILLSPMDQLKNTNFLYLHGQQLENGVFCAFLATPELTPLAYIENVELIETNVKTIESVLEQQASPLPNAWEETWKTIQGPFSGSINPVADIDIDNAVAEQTFENMPETDMVRYAQTRTLLCHYIVNALVELGWQPYIGQKIPDIGAFCKELSISTCFEKLVRFYFTSLQQENGMVQLDEETNAWTVCKVPESGPETEAKIQELVIFLKSGSHHRIAIQIYERMAKYLTKVLKGEESALQLLFPQDPALQEYSAECYYLNYPGKMECSAWMEKTLRPLVETYNQLTHNKEGGFFRILEVGAGTGSVTVDLLPRAREVYGNNFEYYYTDVSQSFFIKVEKRFEEFKENMKYHVFNLEQSPLSQGIPLEYFDMVVATDVLHATRNLEETLIHIRQTLKPGGFVYFTDTIIPALDITFVFGLLEGYWRFTDFQWRQHHCCVKETVWKQLLEKTGFGNVHCFPYYAKEQGIITALVNTNVEVENLEIPRALTDTELVAQGVWLIFAEKQGFGLIVQLANMLYNSGYVVEILVEKASQLEEGHLKRLKKQIKLNYVEWDGSEIERRVSDSKLHGMIYGLGMAIDERAQERLVKPFMHIAKILAAIDKSPQVYVISQGTHSVTEDTLAVHPGAATLFGMAKSLKNENQNVFVRYIDLDQDVGPDMWAKQVLYELAMCRGFKEQLRVQVAYRGGSRYEPRMVKGTVQGGKDDLKLPPSTQRYHLKLPETKMIQDLELHSLEEETVGEGEIEVKTKAFALNFRDIFAIIKPSKEFDNMNSVGLDFAGVVIKAGENTNFKVGERVLGAMFKDAQLPSHIVVEAKTVLRIPETMTYWEAATVPAVFLTAYYCLMNVAKMKKQDTVLIHTGSGGVGLAAIQLAKHVGATIITTAGNPRKRAYLRSLGIEHVFHSRDTSYEQEILRVTNGRGADLVLNSITGPGIKEATLRATAQNGRWVEMSKLSVWTVEEVKEMRSDVDYQIVDLTTLDKDTNLGLMKKMQELLEGDALRSIPFVKFDALSLRQALYYFQKAKHIGKVIVTMPEVYTEKGQYKTLIPLFNAESTYLITGGLGGIGLEVCKWMLERGATDVVLNGRNPPKPEAARDIALMQEQGYNIMVKLGDAGDYQQCSELVEYSKSMKKPLRGIMHCAGVLQDDLYPNQTWPHFEATFSPKVKGTWNLHDFTRECPLEYFVMFSSLTALFGTPGQPNHAAANCFEDAFIHYRHSLGLPGTSINWGVWAEVGCAKDINTGSLLPISKKRMLNGLEAALRTPKKQVCFGEFDSLPNLALICPMLKGYLEDRLWKHSNRVNQLAKSVNADQFWKEMDGAETREEKMDVMCHYLKIIIRTSLRLEPDEPIGLDTDLQEMGVDSLMMIELKNSAQSLLGSRVTLTAGQFKNCNTIRLLANTMVTKLMDGNGEDEQVPLEPLPENELKEMLEKDSVLPDEIRAGSDVKQAVKLSQVKTVLVTGATGNFGPYIIAQLSKAYPKVEKIICLSREDETITKEKLKLSLQSVKNVDLNKIVCVRGDIVKENLGLSSADEFKALCENVDAVIHLAAKSHPMEQFRMDNGLTDSRSVNVVGFLNILRFACAEKLKHVYYPSPLLCGLQDEHGESRLPDKWPTTEVIDYIVKLKVPGIQSAKWICELLMKEANGRGIPCKVFRLPAFGGESETGKADIFGNFALLRYLSFLKLGAMPDIPLPANVLPIDVCAELSLRLFFNENVPNEIFNIAHPHPQLEQEFHRVAEEEFGKTLEFLELKEFEERVKQHEKDLEEGKLGLHRNQGYIGSQYRHIAPFGQSYFDNAEEYFVNEKTSKWIGNYGEDFLPSMEYVRVALKYLKTSGMLEKVGL